MSAPSTSHGAAYGTPVPPRKKRFPIGWVIFVCILLLGGGGFWYYFFGKKPRVVLTVALPRQTEEGGSGRGLWPVGNNEVVVLANGELKLVGLKSRAVKWTAKVPPAPAVDAEQRSAVNARFVRLQQWAEDLNRKRATLKTPQDTKAFNEEAAKYQAELAASREAAAKRAAAPAPEAAKAKPEEKPATPEKKEPAAAEQMAKLKPIVSPEMQLLEARIKRRAAQMTQLSAAITAKKAAAKTEIQLSVVADQERRLATLASEQKDEQAQLAQLEGKATPVAAPAENAPEEKPEAVAETFFVQPAEAFAAVVGPQFWLIDDERIISFDLASGGLKSEMPLAGPVLKAWEQSGEVYAVASAGPEARQVTRITANTGPISLYVAAGKVNAYLGDTPGGEVMARIEKHRTEFSGPLLRADIKLVEKKVVARDTIKPGSDAALVAEVTNAPAHSSEELLAVAKLMQNDGKRMLGATKEFVDESTYEVTLGRPLDTGSPEWKGTVNGRVELFSTASYDLVAAGLKLLAFDRSNRKLWEAPLGARVPPKDPDDPETQICLEAGDRLYFADGAFLTAFEAASGKVLWRLPSIGIRKLQVDGDGKLYVHSLNLPTEALSGTYNDGLGEEHPLTMKVDPESGKIEWQEEKYEDIWVSGRDVYALLEGRRPEDIESQVFDPGKMAAARVKLYKLSRSTGRPVWEWFQPRRPVAVHAQGKTVGLFFDEELQVLHSIAW